MNYVLDTKNPILFAVSKFCLLKSRKFLRLKKIVPHVLKCLKTMLSQNFVINKKSVNSWFGLFNLQNKLRNNYI